MCCRRTPLEMTCLTDMSETTVTQSREDHSKRSSSRSWSKVSNAAVKSRRHRADTCPSSAASSRSLYAFMMAVSVLRNCVDGIKPFPSRKVRSRLWTIQLRALHYNYVMSLFTVYYFFLCSQYLQNCQANLHQTFQMCGVTVKPTDKVASMC